MTQPIRGKVARILNTREIAINVGTAKGVTVGMYFDVMYAPEDISDPDTGEALGSIERPKIRLEITHAQEKFAVATPCRAKQVNIDSSFKYPGLGPFARSLMPPSWVTRYEPLNKTAETWDELDEKDSLVEPGDLVVQVIGKREAAQEDTHRRIR